MFNLNSKNTLLVRDANGDYAPAPSEVILEAARQVIDIKMQRSEKFVSPAAVKDYLRLKLAGYEHEVFAILMLDNQHQLIAYSEMFRGTIDSASIHPREIVKEVLAHNAGALIMTVRASGAQRSGSTDHAALERRAGASGSAGARPHRGRWAADGVFCGRRDHLSPRGLCPPFCCCC